jgi:hypothetical protein
MPSQARRVPLTVPDELDVLLDRLSALQGIPKTKIIINILFEMKPVLVDFIEALEMVKIKKDPTSLLMNMTSRLLGDLSEEVSSYNKFRDSSLAANAQEGDMGDKALPRPSPSEQSTEKQIEISLDLKDTHNAND